jgi:hypothetical protein
MFIQSYTFAQCNVIKTKNQASLETPESYQYFRSNNTYHSISIKTILLRKPSGNFFYIDVKYTGNVSVSHPIALIFKFTNDDFIRVKLRLLRSHTVDNIKLTAKAYEIELADSDLVTLKRNQLREVIIDKKYESVTIPINDPLLLQTQISCLQASLL